MSQVRDEPVPQAVKVGKNAFVLRGAEEVRPQALLPFLIGLYVAQPFGLGGYQIPLDRLGGLPPEGAGSLEHQGPLEALQPSRAGTRRLRRSAKVIVDLAALTRGAPPRNVPSR